MEEEKVWGHLPVDLHRGRNYHFYNVYFTEKRLVFGKTGHGVRTRCMGKFYRTMQSIISWEVAVAHLVVAEQDKSNYSGMTPDEILRTDQANFALDYRDDIKSIKFKKPFWWDWYGGGFQRWPGMVICPTSGKKKTFSVSKEYSKELKALLQRLAGDKLAS